MHQKLPLLMEIAIEPKTAVDADKLMSALEQLTAQSMRLDMSTDRESGQTILHGTSDAVLEEAFARLSEIGIQFNFGAPQVAYREILTRPITIEYTHKKNYGPKGEFALVQITYEPIHTGSEIHIVPGIMFENAAPDSIPLEFVAAVETSIRAQAEFGLKAGYPVIDFCATLVKGVYHEVDSSPRAFDIAARTTFRELANQNVIQIAEPFMRIEVATPEDFLGSVIGDLNSRSAQALETIGNGRIYQLVGALVPLANMFGYRDTLNAMCRGSAAYQMEFDHYEPVSEPGSDDPAFPGAMGMRVA